MNKDERFFGLHFDCHARNDVDFGVRTTKEDIEWYIEQAHPGFIQCDCKGHPGNCSYPTAVGHPADQLRSDNLKVWVDTVHAHDLPVYVHYSGVVDRDFTKKHPEAAACNEKGEPTESTSVFGDYSDKLLIPQLKELIDRYGIDGVWVDGEVWGVHTDYSDCIKPYIYEGISKEERNRVCREGFKRYLKKCVDAIHAYKPDFKYISNWAYSSFMPEECKVDLDFLSGDFDSVDSVSSARFEGRCLAAQNKPWDLMGWSFAVNFYANPSPYTQKSAIQIMREASIVLALGGGFQLYIGQNRDGSAKRVCDDRLRRVADFVHTRRLNFKKKTKAQVGILDSAEARYQKCDVFNGYNAETTLRGALSATLDAGYTAEIFFEYQLDKLSGYDIVVVPEWNLCEETERELIRYAENGGHLLLAGGAISASVGEKLGFAFKKAQTARTHMMSDDGIFNEFFGDCLDLEKGDGFLYSETDIRDGFAPARRLEKCGKGEICFLPFDFGKNYTECCSSFVARDWWRSALLSMSEPVVSVNYPEIDITMQKDENRTFVNLINMFGGNRYYKYCAYDFIPPLHDVVVTVKNEYDRVQMPYGESFTSECADGKTRICIKELTIHSLIVLGD